MLERRKKRHERQHATAADDGNGNACAAVGIRFGRITAGGCVERGSGRGSAAQPDAG